MLLIFDTKFLRTEGGPGFDSLTNVFIVQPQVQGSVVQLVAEPVDTEVQGQRPINVAQ